MGNKQLIEALGGLNLRNPARRAVPDPLAS
jgi:hypothetical protein